MLRKLLLVVLVLTALLIVQAPIVVVHAQSSSPQGLDFNTIFGLGSTGLFLVVLVVLAFAAGHAHGWQAGLAKADQVIQQAANNPAFVEAVRGATSGVPPEVVNRVLTTTESLASILVQFLPPGSPIKQLVGDAEKLAEAVAPPADKNPVQPPVPGGAA